MLTFQRPYREAIFALVTFCNERLLSAAENTMLYLMRSNISCMQSYHYSLGNTVSTNRVSYDIRRRCLVCFPVD